MKKKYTSKWKRVDYQVSIIITTIVLVSFLLVYFFNYTVTYEDMIYTLSERSDKIYNYVENKLDTSTFHNLSSEIDKELDSYIEMQENLSNVREATGVRYLYTAKITENGEFIYLVDGLPSDSEDFRNPGDFIEPEVIPELQLALQNQIVLPNTIKETTWGEIFVSYYPIHENDSVVGVLGIEFPADHQYEAFKMIRIGTPIIAFGSVIVAVLIAVRLFKRISNPTHQDLYNTDFLTNLKNRNAFEIDMKNLNERGTFNAMGMVVADLNDLKLINDRFGHQVGDCYIKEAASIILNCTEGQYPVYRVGGDEFNVILYDVTEAKIRQFCAKIEKKTELAVTLNDSFPLRISIGYALFDPEKDANFTDTYLRGDTSMYAVKRKMKKKES